MTESASVIVEEIRLRQFRAFENSRLNLSDLTFLVGRNGAGKSSILDAVELLREAVSDSLENALDRRGGLKKVQKTKSFSSKNKPMGIAAVFKITFPGGRQTRVAYGFEISGKQTDNLFNIRERFKASKETTFERNNEIFEGKGDVSPPSGNLVLPLIAGSDSIWNLILNTIRNFRAYEFSPAHMATAIEIGERTTLARDGVNAGDVLKAIEKTNAHKWIVERLGIITKGITDVRAEALMGRRVLHFTQNLEKGTVEFDASQVSQGTLRSLGVLLALKQKTSPSIVLVDEIENSVHPCALSVLLDAALASSEGTRVVLTSHSPEVLNHPAVIGERVRVVEWKDGSSWIFRLSPEVEKSVNEIDTVGWMLRSNTLWTGPRAEILEEDDFFTLDAGNIKGC